MTAIYAYAAQHDDELSFPKGAVITVLDREGSSDWWRGEFDGHVGLFPLNYVSHSAEASRGNSGTPEPPGGNVGASAPISIQVIILADFIRLP